MRAHVPRLSAGLRSDLLLEVSNVCVELGQVLFDDLRQGLDLGGGVTKQTPPLCHWMW